MWCWRHWLACTEPWPQSSDSWDKLDSGLRPRSTHHQYLTSLMLLWLEWRKKILQSGSKMCWNKESGGWWSSRLMSVAVMRYSTITLGEVIDCPKNFGHLVQVFYCLGDKIRVDIRHIRPTAAHSKDSCLCFYLFSYFWNCKIIISLFRYCSTAPTVSLRKTCVPPVLHISPFQSSPSP